METLQERRHLRDERNGRARHLGRWDGLHVQHHGSLVVVGTSKAFEWISHPHDVATTRVGTERWLRLVDLVERHMVLRQPGSDTRAAGLADVDEDKFAAVCDGRVPQDAERRRGAGQECQDDAQECHDDAHRHRFVVQPARASRPGGVWL